MGDDHVHKGEVNDAGDEKQDYQYAEAENEESRDGVFSYRVI